MADDVAPVFEEHYSEQGFWAKLRGYALAAGAAAVEKALALYYCANDPETPARAKAIIYGALGYFILPLDVIPDALPVIGYSDDIGLLAAALVAVATHVKAAHADRAKETLRQWFS